MHNPGISSPAEQMKMYSNEFTLSANAFIN